MIRQPGDLRQLLLLNRMTKRSQIIARLIETSLQCCRTSLKKMPVKTGA